jgi:tetratricopeptide (TPR) repeat protein
MNFRFLHFTLVISILVSFISCNNNNESNKKTVVTDLDSLVVLFPDSIPLLLEHGNKMLKEYQFEKALDDGAKAFRLDSNNMNARLLYANVINNQPDRSVKDVMNAQRHFKYILSKDSTNTDALISLATTYSQQLDFENSFININKALKINPKLRDAYVLKGTNYLHLQNMELAKSSYETAIQQDPDFFEAYLMLGSIYQSENNEICIEYYTTAAKLKPNNNDVLYAYAFANQVNNNIEEAKSTYRKMIRLDTTYSQALFQLGYIKQWKENDLDSAMYFYSNTIQTTPNYVEAWHNLGICYLEKGDKPKAQQAFRKALTFDPNFELSKELIKKAQ